MSIDKNFKEKIQIVGRSEKLTISWADQIIIYEVTKYDIYRLNKNTNEIFYIRLKQHSQNNVNY